jgi:hypothetical protein
MTDVAPTPVDQLQIGNPKLEAVAPAVIRLKLS